jgi:hypothetical protein
MLKQGVENCNTLLSHAAALIWPIELRSLQKTVAY